MAKIGLPKGSGKRLKVREKSVKSQGILKWILSGNPVLRVNCGELPLTAVFLCQFLPCFRERSGSVVECLTRDRRAAGSSLTRVAALWSLSKTHLS